MLRFRITGLADAMFDVYGDRCTIASARAGHRRHHWVHRSLDGLLVFVGANAVVAALGYLIIVR
jgi:hypothetical protein